MLYGARRPLRAGGRADARPVATPLEADRLHRHLRGRLERLWDQLGTGTAERAKFASVGFAAGTLRTLELVSAECERLEHLLDATRRAQAAVGRRERALYAMHCLVAEQDHYLSRPGLPDPRRPADERDRLLLGLGELSATTAEVLNAAATWYLLARAGDCSVTPFSLQWRGASYLAKLAQDADCFFESRLFAGALPPAACRVEVLASAGFGVKLLRRGLAGAPGPAGEPTQRMRELCAECPSLQLVEGGADAPPRAPLLRPLGQPGIASLCRSPDAVNRVDAVEPPRTRPASAGVETPAAAEPAAPFRMPSRGTTPSVPPSVSSEQGADTSCSAQQALQGLIGADLRTHAASAPRKARAAAELLAEPPSAPAATMYSRYAALLGLPAVEAVNWGGGASIIVNDTTAEVLLSDPGGAPTILGPQLALAVPAGPWQVTTLGGVMVVHSETAALAAGQAVTLSGRTPSYELRVAAASAHYLALVADGLVAHSMQSARTEWQHADHSEWWAERGALPRYQRERALRRVAAAATIQRQWRAATARSLVGARRHKRASVLLIQRQIRAFLARRAAADRRALLELCGIRASRTQYTTHCLLPRHLYKSRGMLGPKHPRGQLPPLREGAPRARPAEQPHWALPARHSKGKWKCTAPPRMCLPMPTRSRLYPAAAMHGDPYALMQQEARVARA